MSFVRGVSLISGITHFDKYSFLTVPISITMSEADITMAQFQNIYPHLPHDGETSKQTTNPLFLMAEANKTDDGIGTISATKRGEEEISRPATLLSLDDEETTIQTVKVRLALNISVFVYLFSMFVY